MKFFICHRFHSEDKCDGVNMDARLGAYELTFLLIVSQGSMTLFGICSLIR